MNTLRAMAALLLTVLLVGMGYGWWRTAPGQLGSQAMTGQSSAAPVIDTTLLETANRLLPLAGSPAELQLAEGAIAVADHLLDLGFSDALREATEHPAPLSSEARAAQARLDAIAQALVADNLALQALAEQLAKAKGDAAAVLEGRHAIAQIQFEIDQDAFAQAGRDLISAGGDRRGRIQALVAEHAAAAPRTTAPVAESRPGPGLIDLFPYWARARRTTTAVAAAHASVARRLDILTRERDALAGRLSTPGHGSPDSNDQLQSAAALRASADRIGSERAQLASVNAELQSLTDLGQRYADWQALARTRALSILHRILPRLAAIAAAVLVLLFLDGWLSAGFAHLRIDRRQLQTLRTVTAVALQLAALSVVALVVMGPPTQLSTFLGLAGAGLTIALKDFLVAFIGWLVLMGKNGIRIGDWVEIDGVAGEVTELGIFHTVLLETGNWTDSSHPTGRRVTFTNSFAIQGHYFNFSTTGQWLWDELDLVVPAGRDVSEVVGTITKAVSEATAPDAALAEEEWRRATPGRQGPAPSAAPAVSVKPVVGGTQVSVRYIARANDRFAIRSALYRSAVDLLAPRA